MENAEFDRRFAKQNLLWEKKNFSHFNFTLSNSKNKTSETS
jgi:hypothetical protein